MHWVINCWMGSYSKYCEMDGYVLEINVEIREMSDSVRKICLLTKYLEMGAWLSEDKLRLIRG